MIILMNLGQYYLSLLIKKVLTILLDLLQKDYKAI